MSVLTPEKPVRLSTGVFTNEELDYFDSLGPDYFPEEGNNSGYEPDYHYFSVSRVFQLLHRVYPESSGVHIAANSFIYWDRQQLAQVVIPDLYVVMGAGRRIRGVYKTWEEGGRTPDVVIEFASNKTWEIDRTSKKQTYHRHLGVREYFLFDPFGGRYPQKLMGFRLQQGVFQPIPLEGDRLFSEQLNLELVPDGIYLRLFDRKSGKLIPTPAEVEQERQLAEHEVARLRAELDALRGKWQP